ncbi:hypothetical protein ABEB36_013252 [Hypothenemus hampei]
MKLPSFDPFELPALELAQGSQALNFKAKLKNIKVHGLTDYKFSRFDFDVPNLQFFCNLSLNKLFLEGQYLISGRILVAPLEGSGNFTAEFDHGDIYVYQKYKEATFQDGKTYLVPTNTTSKIFIQNPKAHLGGLFSKENILNEAANKAINDNIDELFQDVKPVFEEAINEIMSNLLIKGITDYIPFDELYPIK